PREADRPGLLCANPPYGVRLADREGARTLHRELGEVLRERFQGWDAAVLTGAPELGMELGLRAHRTHRVWNGPIECRLLRIKVSAVCALKPIASSKFCTSRIDFSAFHTSQKITASTFTGTVSRVSVDSAVTLATRTR